MKRLIIFIIPFLYIISTYSRVANNYQAPKDIVGKFLYTKSQSGGFFLNCKSYDINKVCTSFVFVRSSSSGKNIREHGATIFRDQEDFFVLDSNHNRIYITKVQFDEKAKEEADDYRDSRVFPRTCEGDPLGVLCAPLYLVEVALVPFNYIASKRRPGKVYRGLLKAFKQILDNKKRGVRQKVSRDTYDNLQGTFWNWTFQES